MKKKVKQKRIRNATMKSLTFKWKKNSNGKINKKGQGWYIIPSSMRVVRDNPDIWSGDDAKIYELLFKQDRRLKKYEKKRGIYWMPPLNYYPHQDE